MSEETHGLLELRAVSFNYQLNGRAVPVLAGLSWTFPAGSFTAIRGASGSGKSTLLKILGLMESPTSGFYRLFGQEVSRLSDTPASDLRARNIGFLFQDFRLIPGLTVLENTCLPLKIIGGMTPNEREASGRDILERLQLGLRADAYPPQLSGGELQRAALSRALIKNPSLLLADEPTGSLDPANRDRVIECLTNYHSGGGTVILVTHDPVVSRAAQNHLTLEDGRLAPSLEQPAASEAMSA